MWVASARVSAAPTFWIKVHFQTPITQAQPFLFIVLTSVTCLPRPISQAAMEAHATALFSNKVGTNTCSHALLSSSFHFLQQPVIYRANIQEHHARCLQHKGHTVRVPEKVECRLSGHTDTHVVSYPGLQCHPAHSGQTINFSHKFSVLGSQLLRLFRGMC